MYLDFDVVKLGKPAGTKSEYLSASTALRVAKELEELADEDPSSREETTANKEASDEKKEATKQEKGMWDDEVSSMRSLRADDDEVAKDGSVWS